MKALASVAFALMGIHVGPTEVSSIGYAPAWSPAGDRIAFVTRRDVWVMDADGTHRALLVKRAKDPAWAPNGRRLAFTRDGYVWTVRIDGLDERRLGRGANPAWRPDSARIAFDRDERIYSVRWEGGDLQLVGPGTQPAFSAGGKLAVVQDGVVVTDGKVVGEGSGPTWAPDGKRLAYARNGRIFVGRQAFGRGTQPAWRPPLRTRELLPDFDQRAPDGLTITGEPGRWLLGFTSLVDNIGLGAAVITGARRPGAPRMTATQHVRLTNRNTRRYAEAGQLRFTNSPPHYHWHYMRFDVFQLRTLDGRTVVSDRKSGFCLADHYGIAPGTWPRRRPRFLGSCEQGNPYATHVLQGTSRGYTDRYPAFFHGQNVDITHVPPGIYVLVHRANPSLLLHELRYENDAASVRIRIGRYLGRPTVTVLRRCDASASC
jgi:dipeptidyl aminopeptidase/acylaminoacyl peptidase